MSLNVLRVNAPANATASIIILHGLGDSAHGWSFLSEFLHHNPSFQHVNLIFPNAPIKPLTCANGQRISQWFDIYEMGNPNAKMDEDGYWTNVSKVNNLIENEVNNGIDASKIIVGGFSQGASLSLGVAASYEKKLAGILSLSGFFAMKHGIKTRLTDANKSTPIYHGHGDCDPVIGIEYARMTAKYFKEELGFTDYTLKEFPNMAHSTCNEEMQDIIEFFKKNLDL